MTHYPDRLSYIRDLFAPENDAQKTARESLTGDNDKISIYAEEGKLLQLLIRLAGVKTIIEVGTLGGYAALWMAAALPADGHLYTIEKDPDRAARARQNLSAAENISLLEGDAQKVLTDLADKAPFDMMFIDADKLNYLHYLDWAEKHIRKGGLVIGDNTLLFDAVWMQEIPPRVRQTALQVMRDFNKRLAAPAQYHSILLPTQEGMTIAQKLF
jgi:predicted O-methyltransferase YrrM